MTVNQPKSVIPGWIGPFAFVWSLAAIFALLRSGLPVTGPLFTVLLIGLSVLPLIIWEAIRGRDSLVFASPLRGLSLGRVALKTAGLYAVWIAAAVGYTVFPEYAKDHYAALGYYVEVSWIPVVIATPFYVAFVDRRMPGPHDDLYEFGKAVAGHWDGRRWSEVGRFLLGWLIKLYFIPIMAGAVLHQIPDAHFWSGLTFEHAPETTYRWIYFVFMLADVTVVTGGYLLASRALGTHIRSPQPALLGWVVCLICYIPFWNILGQSYIAYAGDRIWIDMFAGGSPWAWLYGGVLVFLYGTYLLTNVTLGLRFSNLTNRGIITNGIFSLSRHPSYLAKNLFWWLFWAPFLAFGNETASDVAADCIMILVLNGIYLARAMTEESHLAEDPEYVRYAVWMDDRGVTGLINRLIPALRFDRRHAERVKAVLNEDGAA